MFLVHRSGLANVNVKKMARACYRYASSELPQSPRTAEDLKLAFDDQTVMERFGRTYVSPNETQTDFFRGIHVSAEFSYAVFASQGIIDLINQNIAVQRRKYSMDATFKICPLGEFRQFLVIYIEYIESVI